MVRYAIVGAGLAGVRLATALLRHGVSGTDVMLVDADDPRRGSGAPAAILHPFPGRTITPKGDGWAEFRRARQWLERARDLGFKSVDQLPMVRPLDDPEVGAELRNSWIGAESDLPSSIEGGIVAGTELARFGSVPTDAGSALWYRPAYVVDLNALVRWRTERLAAEGVAFVEHRVESLDFRTSPAPHWRFNAGEVPIARELVLSAGYGLHRWFPGLATSGTGGELGIFRPGSRKLDVILNASGHIAPAPGGDWVVGSTWWSPSSRGDRPEDAPEPVRSLRRKGTRLHSSIDSMPARDIWSGIRLSFGDHQPLSGPIPGLEYAHVLGAFGSTGLYRTAFHAEQLAGFMVHGHDLPQLADPRRISTQKWAPSPSFIHR